ncbi:hypothetical protein A8990_15418 [Paenibacillus taihuensis]|uniref:Uncharacterized protein n=1 Tax=Paenibacillus taihuensis TaxID=1156355 RepID=A0A3D9Q499_9BACL|nr:hypothetical protein [Paenibacillus taihuensis]REE57472.1 hypothetical protein A8990_15418 [Paenibacillus taihuensis]
MANNKGQGLPVLSFDVWLFGSFASCGSQAASKIGAAGSMILFAGEAEWGWMGLVF